MDTRQNSAASLLDPKQNAANLLELLETWESIEPRTVRPTWQFAEQEVIYPTGQYAGEPFRCEIQPFTRLLFDELDGDWVNRVITGPSQSSKSLCGFSIPALKILFEDCENLGLACPEADMAAKKWEMDLKPIIEASPSLAGMLPQTGSGSRGGVIRDAMHFPHGASVLLFTRGGDDTAKAAVTVRHMQITEAAGWSVPGMNSQEGGPFRQLAARLKGFKRADRRLTLEGTCSIPEELPWSLKGEAGEWHVANWQGSMWEPVEALLSSSSRLVKPCVHCGAWVSPEREHLVGWQNAATEDEAANRAVWTCPACSEGINDDERREMNRDVRILHYGQGISKSGKVRGESPPVSTLWFRWNQFDNCLLDQGDTAVEEWEAAQVEEGTQEQENSEKALCQFGHALPYRSKLAAYVPLDSKTIRKRTDELPRNVAPHDTERIVIGVDLGKWTGYWLALAFRSTGERPVIAYGAFDVMRNDADELDERIVAALCEFRDTIGEVGFAVDGSDGAMLPDAVWIDGGWMPDEVAKFVRTCEGGVFGRRYWLVRGRGSSSSHKELRAPHAQPKRASKSKPKTGKQWYVEINYDRQIAEVTFNADFWKANVDEGLRAKPGTSGAITLPQASMPNEHVKLAAHFANEQIRKEWVEDKGLIEKFVRKGDQHWKDCAAEASAAADYVESNSDGS